MPRIIYTNRIFLYLMKIKHYSLFKKLQSANIDWDALRDSKEEGDDYFIPYSKDAYIASMEREYASKERWSKSIIEFCRDNGLRRVVSIGAGRCAFEYALKKDSDLQIEVSDTSGSINRISSYEIFDDAYQLDLFCDDVSLFNLSTLVLLCRIDTEFEDEDLKRLFNVLREKGASFVCFIPAEPITMRILLAEIKIKIISLIRNQKPVFCGYARTKFEYRKAWKRHYHENTQLVRKDILFLNANK